MKALKRGLGRLSLVLLEVSFAVAGTVVVSANPAAAFQDQWKESGKSLAQYISEGFEIRETLLRHGSPFAKYEYVYFLRKEMVVVRCTEAITTDRGIVVDVRIGCGELVTLD